VLNGLQHKKPLVTLHAFAWPDDPLHCSLVTRSV